MAGIAGLQRKAAGGVEGHPRVIAFRLWPAGLLRVGTLRINEIAAEVAMPVYRQRLY